MDGAVLEARVVADRADRAGQVDQATIVLPDLLPADLKPARVQVAAVLVVPGDLAARVAPAVQADVHRDLRRSL